LKYKDSIESDTSKIKLYTGIAILRGTSRAINEAVEYANKALELSIKTDDFYRVKIENVLGFIHQLLGDSRRAIYHKKQVLAKSKLSSVRIPAYREIIRSYLSLNRDSAHFYANEALKKYEYVEFTDSISGKVLYEIKIFEELTGGRSHQKLIQLYKNGIESKILKNSGKNNIFLGVYYNKINEYDSAVHYFNVTVNKCVEEKDTINIIMAYERLIGLHEKLENTTEMNEAIVLLHDYRFFYEKLDVAKYHQLILMYNEANSTNNTIYIYLGGVFLLVVILLFFFKKIKNKKPKKRKEFSEIEISSTIKEKIKIKLKELENNKEFLSPDFTMAYLENAIGVNRKYISHFFKTEMKISLIDYTNTLRIKQAEGRLKDPSDTFKNYSIEKMANEVGYKTPATFKKYFAKYSDILFITGKN
jgi:YesN/AraC family two-component response regulator